MQYKCEASDKAGMHITVVAKELYIFFFHNHIQLNITALIMMY